MTDRHIKDPEEYLKRFVARTPEKKLMDDKSWTESARLAGTQTREEIVIDLKKQVIDGIIDLIFEE